MSGKLQTIFEILKTNDKELINQIVSELDDKDRNLFNKRFGNDLENPVLSSDWTYSDSIDFYTKLIPNMEKKLSEKNKANSLNIETDKSGNLTIYGLLKTKRKDLVEQIISELNTEDRTLLERRYGKDLENPVLCDDWKYRDTINFYSHLFPKMQDMLKNKETEEIPILDDKMLNEEVSISENELLDEEHLKTEIDIEELKVTEKIKKGRKPKTIYQLLNTDDKDLIMKMVSEKLTDSEKDLFKRRNGEDLDNPALSEDWTGKDTINFNQHLIPKLRRILDRDCNIQTEKQKGLKTMFELLNTNDEALILELKNMLTDEGKSLFDRRNGSDLKNPKHSEDWTTEDAIKFNDKVTKKMRRMLITKQNGLKTMFELLNTNDEALILELKNKLTDEGKSLFDRRNGSDLKNPKHSEDWTTEDAIKFNDKVTKKMRRMLITKQNGRVSRYLPIYKLLNTDDDILIQKVLSRLTPKEQELFWKRNGNDLNNPMPSDDYTYLDENRFNVNLIVKMRKIMNEEKLKQSEDISPEILDINDAKVETDNSEERLEKITEEIMETKEKPIEIKLNDNNALPYFDKVLRKLSIREAVIVSLELVLNFSTDDISKFLNIESKEIKNIVKSSLISYKTYFTYYVDSLIDERENPILVEEKDYIKAINNLSFGELLDRLPLKDTIIVCLSLGLVNKKMYSADEISDFLLITKEDVIKMNKNALLVYKQIINDNINKVIEIVTDNKTK